MKKNKCNVCGNYEIREKEIGKIKPKIIADVYPDIEIPLFYHWKWCKLHNNWCRNIAGNCDVVIIENNYNKKENFMIEGSSIV